MKIKDFQFKKSLDFFEQEIPLEFLCNEF